MTEIQQKFEQLVQILADLVGVDGRPVFSPVDIEEMLLRASFRVGLGNFFKKDARRVVDDDGTARWEWSDRGTRYRAFESDTPYPVYTKKG